MKFYAIQDPNGKVRLEKRKKGLTVSTLFKLKQNGSKILEIIEFDDRFYNFLRNYKNNT